MGALDCMMIDSGIVMATQTTLRRITLCLFPALEAHINTNMTDTHYTKAVSSIVGGYDWQKSHLEVRGRFRAWVDLKWGC